MGLLGFFARKIAESAKESLVEEESQKHFEILKTAWPDIIKHIQDGLSIDVIADHFYVSNKIPVTRTVLWLSSMIRNLPADGSEEVKSLVLRICKQQIRDSVVAPDEYIRLLNFEKTVFGATECRFYSEENKFSAVSGVMVLCKAYLYFFDISAEELTRRQSSLFANSFKERLSDRIENAIPGLDYLSTGWDVLSGMHEVAKDYFDEDRIKFWRNCLLRAKE